MPQEKPSYTHTAKVGWIAMVLATVFSIGAALQTWRKASHLKNATDAILHQENTNESLTEKQASGRNDYEVAVTHLLPHVEQDFSGLTPLQQQTLVSFTTSRWLKEMHYPQRSMEEIGDDVGGIIRGAHQALKDMRQKKSAGNLHPSDHGLAEYFITHILEPAGVLSSESFDVDQVKAVAVATFVAQMVLKNEMGTDFADAAPEFSMLPETTRKSVMTAATKEFARITGKEVSAAEKTNGTAEPQEPIGTGDSNTQRAMKSREQRTGGRKR